MEKQASKFDCPSHSLRLRHLFKRTRSALGVCLVAALLAHLGLARTSSVTQPKTVAKPLTTQFVKRQPRLTKPLELKKRPRPKKRVVQRKMVAVKARVAGRRMGIGPVATAGLVGKLARPKASVSRTTGFEVPTCEPIEAAAVIAGRIESENRLDMSLEMVDVDALDTGRYHAMVIQDPRDKQNVKGYFHFIQAYPVSVVEARGQINEFPRALRNLVEKLSEWTDIRADVERNVPFSSEEIFKVPFIYFDYGNPDFSQRLSQAEAERLGQYMMRGGLYMAEDGLPALRSATDKAARATIEDALAAVAKPKGAEWEFEKIRNDHSIYHVYYDFPGGPPTGGDCARHQAYGIPGPFPWLEGVFVANRLIAIMSNKAYQDVWSLRTDHRMFADARRPSFQMGINIIIFALTQEGSITRRVMDTVQY